MNQTPQTQALTMRTGANIAIREGGGLNFATLADMLEYGKIVIASGFAPPGYEKPESVVIAIQTGAEIGLHPMQSLQNIAVINKRPTVWGDAALALVRASGLLEKYEQKMEAVKGDNENCKAIVTVKRKGEEPIVSEFSVADAKRAGLWDKQGPWKQFPKRMLTLRARAFALRDAFPDVLKGVRLTEEEQDNVPEAAQPTTPARVQASDLLKIPDTPATNPPDVTDAELLTPEPGPEPETQSVAAEVLAVFAEAGVSEECGRAWLLGMEYLRDGEALATVSTVFLRMLGNSREKVIGYLQAFAAKQAAGDVAE